MEGNFCLSELWRLGDTGSLFEDSGRVSIGGLDGFEKGGYFN